MNIEDHPVIGKLRDGETPISVVDGHLVTHETYNPSWWWVYDTGCELRGSITSRGRPSIRLMAGVVPESTVQTTLALYRLHH